MKTIPYLIFNGQAEEAAHFYAKSLGASIVGLCRYSDAPKDSGMPEIPDGYQNKLLHCCINMGEHTLFSLADTLPSDLRTFGDRGSLITLYCDSVEQIEKIYAQFAKEAKKIELEIGEPFFAKRYAEVIDKFGVLWAFIYEGI